jgi:hypothetical protein
MNLLRSKLRWAIIPALVLGLGAAGVSQCFPLGSTCRALGSITHPTKVCRCCKGHCDGRCGMACCQKKAPHQDQLPAEQKSHDESGLSLGLVSALPVGIDFASAGASQHGNLVDDVAAAACPSLLALNIRFNV